MENPAYCQWITNPAHWGGGIELSILASHYRREIAAWNLATGACHVFGEDAGALVLLWCDFLCCGGPWAGWFGGSGTHMLVSPVASHWLVVAHYNREGVSLHPVSLADASSC